MSEAEPARQAPGEETLDANELTLRAHALRTRLDEFRGRL